MFQDILLLLFFFFFSCFVFMTEKLVSYFQGFPGHAGTCKSKSSDKQNNNYKQINKKTNKDVPEMLEHDVSAVIPIM